MGRLTRRATAPSLLAPDDVPEHVDHRDATTTAMTGWTWCTPLAEALGRHGSAVAGTQYHLADGRCVGAVLLDPREAWDAVGGLREDLEDVAQGCAERADEGSPGGDELLIEPVEEDGDAIGWRTVEGTQRSGGLSVRALDDGRVLAVGMQWPLGHEAPMSIVALADAALSGAERFPAEAS